MNGKNLNHERRSLEDIVVVSYLLTPPQSAKPNVPKWREMEMPGG